MSDDEIPGFDLWQLSIRKASILFTIESFNDDLVQFTDADLAEYEYASTRELISNCPHNGSLTHEEPVTVWHTLAVMDKVDTPGKVATYRDAIAAAIIASIESGDLKPKVTRKNLLGNFDQRETKLEADDLFHWAESRGIQPGDFWNAYLDEEMNIHARLQTELETQRFIQTNNVEWQTAKNATPQDIDELRNDYLKIRTELALAKKQLEKIQSSNTGNTENSEFDAKPLATKSESAFNNIIGALCDLYWREIRSANDVEIIQARIIEKLLQEFPGVHGLSERNLKSRISAAINSIRNAG